MPLTNPNWQVKIFLVRCPLETWRMRWVFSVIDETEMAREAETVRDKCRICFLILLSVVLVGWIGGWTRALKAGNEAYTSRRLPRSANRFSGGNTSEA